MCSAQILAMIGFASFPALLPTFISEWHLSNAEAGWISGLYFAGYMGAVPVLVGITDRIDPRTIFAISFGSAILLKEVLDKTSFTISF